MDDRVVDREVAAGRWTRPVPRVTVAASAPAERQLVLAALVHTAPDGALTGRAACRAYRLRDVPGGGPVEVLLPHGVRRVSTPWVRVLRTTSVVEVRTLLGLPVVAPGRALADAARGLARLQDVRALVLAAVADGAVSTGSLRAELAAGPRAGSGHLRRALADAQRGAASAPEAEFAERLLPWARRRGLTLLLNPVLVLAGRLLCVPDAYLVEVGVGVETESLRHHGSGQALSATLRRHARVERGGVRLLHETPWSLRRETDAVLARVAEEVRLARPVPAGLVVLPHDDPGAARYRPARGLVPGVPTRWLDGGA